MIRFIFILATFYTILACKPVSDQSTSTSMQATLNQITDPNIDVVTAKKMISQSNDIVLIDVRTSGEVSQGMIPNALHIDISQSDFNNKIAALDKNKEYIIYCAVGGRSYNATNIMQKMGFKKVHNMMGGYNAWIKK